MPFAGIAFFWFTGVIRYHIGDREDRFFITFFGNGIAFVVFLIIYAAISGRTDLSQNFENPSLNGNV